MNFFVMPINPIYHWPVRVGTCQLVETELNVLH